MAETVTAAPLDDNVAAELELSRTALMRLWRTLDETQSQLLITTIARAAAAGVAAADVQEWLDQLLYDTE